MGSSWKSFEVQARNTDVGDSSGEGSNGRSEEHVLGNWRKGHPCSDVAKDLAELRPSVSWKAELWSEAAGCSAEIPR